ncbi:hypothetical protein COLO4_18087 [Corchorus olitorius]|uniref:Uncharacterized protein n=1 Tax=Corchorus olitorius TaxID=93759 RepID=A0A1R3JAH0_9ROSI|nr:hypothetical protein COLO4_18087 [Corchorus olitorius]
MSGPPSFQTGIQDPTSGGRRVPPASFCVPLRPNLCA